MAPRFVGALIQRLRENDRLARARTFIFKPDSLYHREHSTNSGIEKHGATATDKSHDKEHAINDSDLPLVHRTSFNLGVGAAVTVNSLVIGLEEDFRDQAPEVFEVFEHMFTLFFLIELSLKLLTDGKWYFLLKYEPKHHDPDDEYKDVRNQREEVLQDLLEQTHMGKSGSFFEKSAKKLSGHAHTAAKSMKQIVDKRPRFNWWNILDFCLVTVAIIDAWILSAFSGSSDLRAVSVLRLMRLLRLLRLLRAFKELQLVVSGLMSSTKTVTWVGLLLLVLFYAFGVVITHNVGKGDEEYARREELWDYTYGSEQDRVKFWGSVLRSMLTLFLISTLEGWEDVTRPIVEARPHYALIFLFFIAIAAFGVLNIVVGVITESTFKIARKSEKAEQKRRLKAERRCASSLRSAFYIIDGDGKGTISEQEFEEALKTNADIQVLMKELQLPQSEMRELFDIMDPDGSGEIEVDEFIRGFMKIKEHSSATEQLGAYLRIQAMQANQHELVQKMAAYRKSQDRLAELLLPQPVEWLNMYTPTPRGDARQKCNSSSEKISPGATSNSDVTPTPRSDAFGPWRKAKDQLQKASAQRLEIHQDGRVDPLARELGRQIGRTLEDRLFEFEVGEKPNDVVLTDGKAAKTMLQFAELVEDLLKGRSLRAGSSEVGGGSPESKASFSPPPRHGDAASSQQINGSGESSSKQKGQPADSSAAQASASDSKQEKPPEPKAKGPETPFAAVMGAPPSVMGAPQMPLPKAGAGAPQMAQATFAKPTVPSLALTTEKAS